MRNLFNFYFDSFGAALKMSWKWAAGIATGLGILIPLFRELAKPKPEQEATMTSLLWQIPVLIFVIFLYIVVFIYTPYWKYQKLKKEAEDKEQELKKEAEEREKKLREKIKEKERELQTAKDQSEAEKAELLSQLEAERAKNAKPEIRGGIQKILVSDMYNAERKAAVGTYVTVKASLVNVRPVPTKIRSFKLRMKVKEKIYESENFHRSELYKQPYKLREDGKSPINNLADPMNSPKGLEHNVGVEGHIRFFVEGLLAPRLIIQDERWEGLHTEDDFFDLADIKEVSLIVTDYFTDYEIVASEITPQWKNVIS